MSLEDHVCRSYCPHGGICTEPPRHLGPHRLRLREQPDCQWTDSQAIPAAEADRRWLARQPNQIQARLVLALQRALEALIEEHEADLGRTIH